MEEPLKDIPSFVRLHHSYLVNMNDVNKYIHEEGGCIIMSDNPKLNVSRSCQEA
jgi:two-component system LytT family response regulator